jgi:hypothetical protein
MGYTSNGKLLEALLRVEGKLDSILALAKNFLEPRKDDPRSQKPFQPTVANLPSVGPVVYPNGIIFPDISEPIPFDFGYRGGETEHPEFFADKPGEPQKLWHRAGVVHEIPFDLPQGKSAEITVHPTPVMGIALDRGTTQVMVTVSGPQGRVREGVFYLDSAPRWSLPDLPSGRYVMRITSMNIEGGFAWQCWMR